MNKPSNLIIGLLLYLASMPGLYAQEVIIPLFNNPLAEAQQRGSQNTKKSTAVLMLDLPLFDDFSTSTIVPDPAIWSDDFAFVNNNFCNYSPYLGNLQTELF